MSDTNEAPKPTHGKRHYRVEIKFDDPYPKTHIEQAMEARTHGRAIDFACRALRRTRKGRHEPRIVHAISTRL